MDIPGSFFLSCQYGILHDRRNISEDETLWKKTIYQFLILLPADFRKFARNFGQRCQNCNQRVQSVFVIIFYGIFFEVPWT